MSVSYAQWDYFVTNPKFCESKTPTVSDDAFFRLSGSNNDIDVWNLSKFKTLMMSAGFATHIKPESPYFIGDEAFTVLWNTELACFVKMISVPDSLSEEEYVKWQESVRKAIGRAFGVIQSKYCCLVGPGQVELHNPKEIHDMVIGCMKLHNMMVDLSQTSLQSHITPPRDSSP